MSADPAFAEAANATSTNPNSSTNAACSSTMAILTTPCNTFTCSPKSNDMLVIQEKLWEAFWCSDPRVIDIFFGYNKHEYAKQVSFGGIIGFPTRIRAYTSATAKYSPAILHTSRHARKVDLLHYSLAPGNVSTYGHNRPRIYVNYAIDTICPLETFQLTDEEGDVKELNFFKKYLPDLRLNELIVYLVPGLDQWQSNRTKRELEDCCGCCVANPNSALKISLVEWEVARHDGPEDEENEDDEEDWDEFYYNSVPDVEQAMIRALENRLVSVAEDLQKKAEGSDWMVPVFKARVMEIHAKDDWTRYS